MLVEIVLKNPLGLSISVTVLLLSRANRAVWFVYKYIPLNITIIIFIWRVFVTLKMIYQNLVLNTHFSNYELYWLHSLIVFLKRILVENCFFASYSSWHIYVMERNVESNVRCSCITLTLNHPSLRMLTIKLGSIVNTLKSFTRSGYF